ncbi:MAG TPA: hypothetical protein VJQ09_07285 [Candidatus Limnocylindria bacterium]|nr:hypothetical protein [Candidatus Limnocylindria bacterium]
MTRRDATFVGGALVVALALSALLFVGTMASEPAASAATARPRIFFDLRNTPPPAARTIADVQERVGPFAVIVPLQRNMTDTARDAAGFLLIVIVTATTLLLAHDRVVSAYRASLGGWRTQLRVLLTGIAVLGLGLSATALAWVVYLGYVATTARGTPFGVPAALQIGMAAFGVILVVLLGVLAIGFAATAWRLGDTLLRPRPLARWGSAIPTPLVAVIGATVLYLLWQIPAAGGVLLALVVAYALGAVVSARRLEGGTPA